MSELDEAWAAVESALPEGWTFHGVSAIGESWHALALGRPTKVRCDQGVEHNEFPKAGALAETPAAALRALTEKLLSHSPREEKE